MQRENIVLLAVVCVALAGALAMRRGFSISDRILAFALDKALLARRLFPIAALGWGCPAFIGTLRRRARPRRRVRNRGRRAGFTWF